MHKQGGVKRAEGEADWQKIKTTSTQASRPLLGLICHCLPNWVTGQDRSISLARLSVDWVSCWASWVASWFQCSCKQEPEETDICVCSQGMWNSPSHVYKDWAVPLGLIILSSPFFLSHKEIHTNRFFPPTMLALCSHTDCTFSPIVSEFLLVLVLQICKLLCCNKQAMNHAICAQ